MTGLADVGRLKGDRPFLRCQGKFLPSLLAGGCEVDCLRPGGEPLPRSCFPAPVGLSRIVAARRAQPAVAELEKRAKSFLNAKS